MKKYTDNKQGALQCAVDSYDKKFIATLGLDTCKVFPDPVLAGVWGIDSMKSGHRVIIWMEGFKDAWGDVRPHSDVEEGGIPFKDAKKYFTRNDVTKRQLGNWVKAGNINNDELAKLIA